MNIFVVLRVILGIFFIVSGSEKLISPKENFLYVVQSYEVLPKSLENIVVQIIPWWEFLLGVFLMLGLWLKPVLMGLMILTAMFINVVGQAIIRDLPITECGCFGDLVSVPLPVVLTMDSTLLVLFIFLLIRLPKTSCFSLDHSFYAQAK